MRFSETWAKLARQHSIMKGVVTFLSVTIVFQSLAFLGLTQKQTVIVERSCQSTTAIVGDNEQTQDEIKSFLNEALPQRFDSGKTPEEAFFSEYELKARDIEQTELAKKELRQKIIVSRVEFGESIMVIADRIITHPKVRSILEFSLLVTLNKTERTRANPYGLVLVSTKQKIGEDKSDAKN